MNDLILVLDFGGQYKELIARSVRSNFVYSEVISSETTADEIKNRNPIGLILTGGPDSVNNTNSIKCDKAIFELDIPILGICYGMQIMAYLLGGSVSQSGTGEYGKVTVAKVDSSEILSDEDHFYALMSHRDSVSKLPYGFKITAETANCIAACENPAKKLYGVQFHPETKHTQNGSGIFRKL